MRKGFCIYETKGKDMFTLSNLGFFRTIAPAAHPMRKLRTMLRVAQERRALANLPTDRLRDIGRSASEAREEASRAMWDVPSHWRR
jgi:uncharacterized protein YjiS (DUF1127 family)